MRISGNTWTALSLLALAATLLLTGCASFRAAGYVSADVPSALSNAIRRSTTVYYANNGGYVPFSRKMIREETVDDVTTQHWITGTLTISGPRESFWVTPKIPGGYHITAYAWTFEGSRWRRQTGHDRGFVIRNDGSGEHDVSLIVTMLNREGQHLVQHFTIPVILLPDDPHNRY